MYIPRTETIKYSNKAIILSTVIVVLFLILNAFNILHTNYECITNIMMAYAIFVYICLVLSNFE